MDPSTPKVLTHCPLCRSPYRPAHICLLRKAAGMSLYHLKCDACRHSVLAVIVENPNGVSSVGLVTDMEAQDAVRLEQAEPVSADDCVRLHIALEEQSRAICRQLTGG